MVFLISNRLTSFALARDTKLIESLATKFLIISWFAKLKNIPFLGGPSRPSKPSGQSPVVKPSVKRKLRTKRSSKTRRINNPFARNSIFLPDHGSSDEEDETPDLVYSDSENSVYTEFSALPSLPSLDDEPVPTVPIIKPSMFSKKGFAGLSKITDGKLLSRLSSTLENFDLGVFQKIFDRFSNQLSSETGDFALSLVSLFYKLYRLRDIADLFFAAFDFIRSTFSHASLGAVVGDVKEYIIAGIRKLYNSLLMAPPAPESRILDLLISVKGNMGTILNSDLVTSLRDFVLGLVSFKVFSKEKATGITKMLGPAKSVSGFGFLDIILEGAIQIFSASDRYTKDGTINSILNAENPVEAFVMRVSDLELQAQMCYSGMPVDGKICIREYAHAVKECVDAGKIIIDATPVSAPDYKQLKISYRTIFLVNADIVNKMSGTTRAMPFVVAIVGPPGVGKGLLIEFIARIWSKVKGRVFHDSHIFHRNAMEKFWSGYEAPSMPFISYSEPGALHKDIAKSKGDPVIGEFLSVCDNLPFSCPMADLESKGNVYCTPECVLMDCNDPALNLKELLNNPAAFRRRILFIKVTVKPEFTHKGTCRLDVAISIASELPPLDRYTFEVYRMEPKNNVESITEKKMFGDIYTLTEWLTQEFALHIAAQEERMDISSNLDVDLYMNRTGDRPYVENIFDGKVMSGSNPYAFKADEFVNPFADDEDENPIKAESKPGPPPKAPKDPNELSQGEVDMHVWATHFATLPWWAQHSVNGWIYTKFIREFYYYLFTACFSFLWLKTLGTVYNFCTLVPPGGYKIMGLAIFRSKIDYQKLCFERRWNLFRQSIGLQVLGQRHFTMPLPITIVRYLVVFSLLQQLVRVMRVGTVFTNAKPEGNIIQTSAVRTEEDTNTFLIENEKESGCELPPPRVAKPTAMKWDRVARPPAMIGDEVTYKNPKEILVTVNKNVRYMEIYGKHSSGTTAFGICKDYAIINRHSLSEPRENGTWLVKVFLTEGQESSRRDCILTFSEMAQIEGDIILVRLRGCKFKDVVRYFHNNHVKTAVYGINGYIGMEPVNIKSEDNTIRIPAPKNTGGPDIVVEHPLLYDWEDHRNGKCGTPLLMNNGTAFGVAGIHVAGAIAGDVSYSHSLCKRDILTACKKINNSSIALGVNSEGALRLPIGVSLVPDTTPRSCLNFEKVPGLSVYGSLKGFNVVPPSKSKLRSTEFIHVAKELIGVSPFDEEGKPLYGAPPMTARTRTLPSGERVYRAPNNNFIKKVGVIKQSLNPKIMEKTIEVVSHHIIDELKKVGVTHLDPIPLEVAQNGYPLDVHMRAMKPSTSGGFLWPGPKKNYSTPVALDFKEDSYMPTWDVREQVQEQLLSYAVSKDAHPLLGAQLKDEARTYQKIFDCKTRVFCMSSYESTLVNRMYLMPFYSLMVAHSSIFGSCVGINMHSTDVDEFVNSFSQFIGSPLDSIRFLLEGDYSGYDTSMPLDVGLMANTVVYKVLKALGYNEHALNMVKGILSDNLNPVIVMLGNVFAASAFQPSGKYATAEDNSLRGLLMLVYCWVATCTDFGYKVDKTNSITRQFAPRDFYFYILARIYGDDVLAAVKKPARPFFNNNTYQAFCRKVYGLDFTNAQKTLVMEDFLSIHEASFLKRSFVYNESLQHWTAPLDLSSIMKSICYYLPSKSISMEEQLIDSCTSAQRELFFHLSEKEFEPRRNAFAFLCAKFFDLKASDIIKNFPRYDAIKQSIYGHVMTNPSETNESGITRLPEALIESTV